MFYRVICILLIIIITGSAFSEELTIRFLDVGQADAALISCDGKVLLIDGGNTSDSSFIYSYLRNTMGIEHIDHIIATHPHEDHIGGIAAALNACSVDTLYTPVPYFDSKAFSSMMKYAVRQGIPLTIPAVGDSFSIGAADVQFLSPAQEYSDINDMSIIVRITYGNTAFLFMGDAGYNVEQALLESSISLSADVLKVGHHGSESGTSYSFLREVMPHYAIISVGKDNPYGHPSEDTLSRLNDAEAVIFRTDLDGTIICHSDGEKIWFETE